MADPARGEVWDAQLPPPIGRRPVVVLTRDVVLPRLRKVTVAPVTSTIRGIPTEVELDERAGLDRVSVASCDNLTTISKRLLVRRRGRLSADELRQLAAAVRLALDVDPP